MNEKWINACKWFRENLESENRTLLVTIRQMEILLRVAAQPGVAQNDLSKSMGVSVQRISKNIQVLGSIKEQSATGNIVDTGLGLIKQVNNGVDTRKKYLYLTAKGETFMQEFLSKLS